MDFYTQGDFEDRMAAFDDIPHVSGDDFDAA
jgi:hypothetical protein